MGTDSLNGVRAVIGAKIDHMKDSETIGNIGQKQHFQFATYTKGGYYSSDSSPLCFALHEYYPCFIRSPVRYDALHGCHPHAAERAWLWQPVPGDQLPCQSLPGQRVVPAPGHCDHCALRAPARQWGYPPATAQYT